MLLTRNNRWKCICVSLRQSFNSGKYTHLCDVWPNRRLMSTAAAATVSVCPSPLLRARLRAVGTGSRSLQCGHKRNFSEDDTRSSNEWDEDVERLIKDNEYEEFSDRMFRMPEQGHKVFVIQPYIRFGSEKKRNTTPQFQLEEAVALINTLPKWSVVDTETIPLYSFNTKELFGSGTVERLQENVRGNRQISAVFVSLDILRVVQKITLESFFHVPVYDRYTIVVQIFRQHAISKESKLQVAMGEIPYLRQCLKGIPKGFSDSLGGSSLIGGSGNMNVEKRRELLFERELKLKQALERLRKHRERLRINRNKFGFPVIAIVGYTNTGKTSLIKALTGEDRLMPRDQLFATLDVTKHGGQLPCNLRVLYVDTVGFITDIPTPLLESFTATLEDAIFADIVVHVWDVSNPDHQKQREHVWQTMKSLRLSESLLSKVFEVGNKVDRLSEDELQKLKDQNPDMTLISAKTGEGVAEMLQTLEKFVLKATNRSRIVIRSKTGGEEYMWLRKSVAVENIEVDGNDSQYSLLTVIITEAELNIFKHRFIQSNKKERMK